MKPRLDHHVPFNDGASGRWRWDPWRIAKAFAWLTFFVAGVYLLVMSFDGSRLDKLIAGFLIILLATMVAAPRRTAIV